MTTEISSTRTPSASNHRVDLRLPPAGSENGPGTDPALLQELLAQLGTGQISVNQLPPAYAQQLDSALAVRIGKTAEHVEVDMNTILAELMRSALKLKESESLAKNAAATQKVNAMAAAADEARKAAEDRGEGARINGAMQIASGALEAGAGLGGLRSGMKANKAAGVREQNLKAARDADAEAPAGQLTPSEATRINQLRKEIDDFEASRPVNEGDTGSANNVRNKVVDREVEDRQRQIDDLMEQPNKRQQRKNEAKDLAGLAAGDEAKWRTYEAAANNLARLTLLKAAGEMVKADFDNKAELHDAQGKKLGVNAEGAEAQAQAAGGLSASAEAQYKAIQDVQATVFRTNYEANARSIQV